MIVVNGLHVFSGLQLTVAAAEFLQFAHLRMINGIGVLKLYQYYEIWDFNYDDLCLDISGRRMWSHDPQRKGRDVEWSGRCIDTNIVHYSLII